MKNMKKDSVSAYVHIGPDIPSPLYAAVHILDDRHPPKSYVRT